MTNRYKDGKKTKAYCAYDNMKRRCLNKSHPQYYQYGGRGIVICKEWLLNYDSFFKWAELNGIKDGLQLDRINNDGNYEPSNCRWVTSSTNIRNQRILKSTNKSGYRGVSFCKSRNRWESSIKINYIKKMIGRYKTAIEAAKAYDGYVLENNLEHTINGIIL